MGTIFDLIGDTLSGILGDNAADASISQDGSANIHGNPSDTNGHGSRPSDGQGNTAGRDIQGGANNKTLYD